MREATHLPAKVKTFRDWIIDEVLEGYFWVIVFDVWLLFDFFAIYSPLTLTLSPEGRGDLLCSLSPCGRGQG